MDLNCDFNKMLLKFFTFENEFFPVILRNIVKRIVLIEENSIVIDIEIN